MRFHNYKEKKKRQQLQKKAVFPDWTYYEFTAEGKVAHNYVRRGDNGRQKGRNFRKWRPYAPHWNGGSNKPKHRPTPQEKLSSYHFKMAMRELLTEEERSNKE